MTAPLERLRAANPIPECPPAPPIEDVWQKLGNGSAARVGAGIPARRAPARGAWLRVALGAVLLAGVLAVVLESRGAGPSIAAQAYAATASNGILVHFRETTRAQPASGLPGQ